MLECIIGMVGGKAKGNYMQDSTSWRGWGGGQKGLIGWAYAAEAYCGNVNPFNVVQLGKEQDHQLNRQGGERKNGGGDCIVETLMSSNQVFKILLTYTKSIFLHVLFENMCMVRFSDILNKICTLNVSCLTLFRSYHIF